MRLGLPVQEEMGPKLAVLREECTRLGLSLDRAETLVMLIEDATVPQVIDTLQKYTENFEAVCAIHRRRAACWVFLSGGLCLASMEIPLCWLVIPRDSGCECWLARTGQLSVAVQPAAACCGCHHSFGSAVYPCARSHDCMFWLCKSLPIRTCAVCPPLTRSQSWFMCVQAANHLLNTVAKNSGLDSSAGDGTGSPGPGRDRQAHGFPWQQPAAMPEAAPGPAANCDARAVAASQDAWGGEAAPPRRRKKKGKGKALNGCFEAVPTPYAGTVSKPSQQQSLAAVLRSAKDPGAGTPGKGVLLTRPLRPSSASLQLSSALISIDEIRGTAESRSAASIDVMLLLPPCCVHGNGRTLVMGARELLSGVDTRTKARMQAFWWLCRPPRAVC